MFLKNLLLSKYKAVLKYLNNSLKKSGNIWRKKEKI